MNTIKYNHDRMRNGDFPVEKLEKINGITVTKNKTDMLFVDEYIIEVDMTNEPNTIQDIAFMLGAMVQSHIHSNLIK